MRQHYPLNSNGVEDAGQMPWSDGVPSTGTQGSYPGHAIVTDGEAEILAAIDAAGLSRNGADLAQLAQAIGRGLFLGQFGGSANALTASLQNNVTFASLQAGTRFTGAVSVTNTGGVTVAIAGIGNPPTTLTAPLLRQDGTALQGGDLPVNRLFDFRYTGTAFQMLDAAVVAAAVVQGLKAPRTIIYAAGSGTIPVPPGATGGFAELWGGGGGGGGVGSTNNGSGSGGGGGEYVPFDLPSLVGVTGIPYVVGAGGLAGGQGGNGGNGGATSLGAYATAGGGKGGTANGVGQGGAGGTGSGMPAAVAGGYGSAGAATGVAQGGQAGGSSSGGQGGGGAPGIAGAGTAPGGGGGGSGSTTLNPGAPGAPGGIRITWK